MKIAIIYKSKTGFAAKYAIWISEESGGDLFNAEDVKPELLEKYDTIVYVGGMYAGGINGFSFVKKNYSRFNGKRIVLVGVGGSPVDSKNIPTAMERNLTAQMKDVVKWFYFRGGYDYEKMRKFDRFIMKTIVKMMKKRNPETLDKDAKDMIDSFGKLVDFSSRNGLNTVISFLRKE